MILFPRDFVLLKPYDNPYMDTIFVLLQDTFFITLHFPKRRPILSCSPVLTSPSTGLNPLYFLSSRLSFFEINPPPYSFLRLRLLYLRAARHSLFSDDSPPCARPFKRLSAVVSTVSYCFRDVVYISRFREKPKQSLFLFSYPEGP